MYPLKVPGLDGMPPLFFQHFWPTIGDVVIKTVLDFLNAGISPPNFHDTHIMLVPKCKEPKRIIDYRPISLCNVVYKVASKSRSYHLLVVIPKVTLYMEGSSLIISLLPLKQRIISAKRKWKE